MTAGHEDRGLFTVRCLAGGRKIISNDVVIREILGIPHNGVYAYEINTGPMCQDFDYGAVVAYLQGNVEATDAHRKVFANKLNITYRMLRLICTHNLIHPEKVTFMDVFAIEHLLREILSTFLTSCSVMRMRMRMMRLMPRQ